MKSINRHLLITILVVAILAAVVLTLGTNKAEAQLGNSGIPVRCFKSGASLAPGSSTFLSCVASDGTPFAEGQRVPAGHYLLVTDVLITPDAGTDTAGLSDINVFDAYGDNSRQSSFRLRNNTSDSFGTGFNAPYLVLIAGHRLEVLNATWAEYSVEIRVSGLLVTNLSYLPILQK